MKDEKTVRSSRRGGYKSNRPFSPGPIKFRGVPSIDNLHDEHTDANMREEKVQKSEKAEEREGESSNGGQQVQGKYNYTNEYFMAFSKKCNWQDSISVWV